MIRRNWDYILLYLFLTLSSSAIWHLFFVLEIFKETDKILVALIPALALIIGVFQIVLNQINQKRTKLFELRYQEFKNQLDLIQRITDLINDSMTGYSTVEVHGLVGQILNLVNEFISFNRFQNEFLFKNITSKEATKRVREILEKILERTDIFRKQIDDTNKKDSVINDIAIQVHQMNWHNDIREHLKELHEHKDGYLNELKSFLN